MCCTVAVRSVHWEGVGKCRCNVVVSGCVRKDELKVERVMLV